MECCGKIVTTPFCPLCGKRWGSSESLHTLLAYLEQQAGQAEAVVRRNEKILANSDASEAVRRRRMSQLPAHKKRLAKFKAWVHLIRVALKNTD